MNIVLYVKTGCPWCKEVLEFLRKHDVSFEERECRGNQAHFDELVAKTGQTKTPTFCFGDEILADTDASAIEKFLKERDIL